MDAGAPDTIVSAATTGGSPGSRLGRSLDLGDGGGLGHDDRDAAGRGRHRGVERGVLRDRQQVDRRQLERLRLVEPGEFEQVLDERAHADRLALDAVHRLRDILGVLDRAHPVQLGVAAQRDQRRAQLVRGVADEPAHLLDRPLAVGEGPVDAREHGVERSVEAPDLGVRRGAAEALAVVAGGEASGGRLDVAQRGERRGHQQLRGRGAEHDDGDREAEEDHRVPGDDPVGRCSC